MARAARTLNPQELRQLHAARRRMWIDLALLLGAVLVLFVILLQVNAVIGASGGLIGAVFARAFVTGPYQRRLRETGLTQAEAAAILKAEREQRTGLAQQSPQRRSAGERRTALILFVLGVVAVVLLVVAAVYVFTNANKDSTEVSAPLFAISVFGGFACLIAAPSLLLMADRYRRSAADRLRGRR